MTSRRQFFRQAARAGVGAAALGAFPFPPPLAALGAPAVRRSRVRPVAVASANGLAAVAEAMRVLASGGDTLEAVVRGVNIVERDPGDRSVGYGGLPNEDGVVQLDASVMHGPTRGAGAVAALEGVRTPSLVAVAVMRYTDHVLLVGEGARRFARAMGFDADEELLTEEARLAWLRLRARLSPDDDWLTPEESGEGIRDFTREPGASRAGEEPAGAAGFESFDGVRPMGTINCNAVDAAGNVSGVTTTSGLFYKLSGRVGDSPIIGAGLYADNDVGSAGSTGRGEAVIKTCGAHTVIELLRQGRSPTDACLEACRRIVRWTVEKRLLRPDGRPDFDVNFYAVNTAGEYGAASIWSGGRYAVNVDGAGSLQDAAYLLQRA
ncbi:MAG TPA: N(4)-(beta-N-acetylglucosaminyl)-L-asparaginase [Longimicrobiales bacterium]|nr:N(4)-(beta-N-acetylglucosaminyl)-L-asparaginase [Longimicrobiales bacterium]